MIHTTNGTGCVICGGRYTNVAKPRYVLDLVGHVVGTAHTSCHERTRWMREAGMSPLIGRFAKSERAAQMDFYIHEVKQPSWPVAYLASAENFEDRARALAWWKTGPMHATAEWLMDVQRAYQELFADFEAWRLSI